MTALHLIEEALTKQKQEILHHLKQKTCPRYEEHMIDLGSNAAQVVIGVRRSGKSTLCHNVLRTQDKTFAYVNFDDERLAALKSDDLNEVLRILYSIYEEFDCLFLDEMQNVTEWYLFVNRLLRQGMHILLTGSNAKLLSGEFATHLTGRHTQVELFPFSFKDYCNYHKIDVGTNTTRADGLRRRAFDSYLREGGFPEIVKHSAARSYIDDLLKDIIYRDIQTRYNIRYIATFNQIANYLLNVVPLKVNIRTLQTMFRISSYQTLHNYLSYLKQAYLLIGIHKYSAKSQLRIRDEKLYAVDPSLMDNRRDAFSGDNLGWRLETIVLIELLRRHRPSRRDIYYYSETAGEADFVVCKGNQTLEILQVAYDISLAKTRKRELKGLDLAAKATGCQNLTIVTAFHREEATTASGIPVRIIPAHEWLLR